MATEQLLSDETIFAVTHDCIDAWNTQDVEATLAFYTDDVVYSDPKTGGQIVGKDALRRYLQAFFAAWHVTFEVTDDLRIAGRDAQLCVWTCTFKPHGGEGEVTIDGMDICTVRGGQLCRDEAAMDTAPLAGLR